MKTKKRLLGVTAALIVGVLIIGIMIAGSLASFNTQTDREGTTDISAKQLSIDLTENGAFYSGVVGTKLMPGAKMDKAYYVTNSAENGYVLYTRVTVYKYWDDDSLDPAKVKLYVRDSGVNGREVELTESASLNNDWIVHYVDDEQAILYYTKPLAPGETTTNLMDFLKVAPSINNEYDGASLKLDVDADAVQILIADKAIPSEWGVYPTFDENGNITAIAD